MKNKHKILSFALVASMNLAMLPLGVSAACSHGSTHTEYQAENANDHSYYAVCDYCGDSLYGWQYSGWSSHDFSVDGRCMTCGYEAGCSHGSSSTSYSSYSDSSHSYTTTCDYCDETLYYGTESHSLNVYGRCMTCGYEAGCPHGSTSTDYSSNDSDSHSYTTTCDYCDETLSSGSEGHSFSGDSCRYCGYERCSHSSTSTVYQAENADEHSYYAVCDYCGDSLYGWAYSGWSSHDFSVYGRCMTCGYDAGCPHGSTSTDYSSENADSHSYRTVCDYCDDVLSSGSEGHSFSGNTCSCCGYEKCGHSSTSTVYRSENENEHSYYAVCDYCGENLYGWQYSGWSSHEFSVYGRCMTCGYDAGCPHSSSTTKYSYQNESTHSYRVECNYCSAILGSSSESHSFNINTCTKCGYTRTCTHTDYKAELGDYSDSQHRSYRICNYCGLIFNESFAAHSWTYGKWTAASEKEHSRIKSCQCGNQTPELSPHTFNGKTCTTCGYMLQASVSFSASGPSGSLDSGGGELVSEIYPASYTVTANAIGCRVTKIEYYDDGMFTVVSGDSASITADSPSDFTTTTFTAYTDIPGVTATITVNFKYVVKGLANIMWETTDEATIRSITGDNFDLSLSYSMTLPTSYNSQSNLTDSQIAELQSLIGRNDGSVYTVNYTRSINVYIPAEYSGTGEKKYLASYDGGSDSDIEDCVNTWGWTSGTASAIRQAANSSLSFTTAKKTNCTAYWIDSSSGKQLYTTPFGEGYITPSQSLIVSVDYSEFSDSGKYIYESLDYSGDTDGTSTSQSYSQTYTVNSLPLTVTFYCKPKPTQGNITVYVCDAKTGMSISGASVDSSLGSRSTDSSGSTTYSKVALGSYSFTASKSGYESGSGSVDLTSATSESVTIYLVQKAVTPTQPTQPTKGSITVYVQNSKTGAAISGASVSGSYSGSTDSSGSVDFSDVPFGTYSFSASKSGYSSDSGSVTISASDPSGSLTLSLTPDEPDIPDVTPPEPDEPDEPEEPEYPDEPYEPEEIFGRITVIVRDDYTNEVISGANVSGSGYSGTTGSSGNVRFTNLSLGYYSFTASKSGYISDTGSARIDEYSTTASVTIYLTPESTEEPDPEPEVPTTGSITVTVKDAKTDAVISGATVSSGSYSRATNSSGKAAFYSMPFGSYNFTAAKAGYITNSKTTSISSSSTNSSITIYLTPATGTITVTVLDSSNGNVIPGASITNEKYSGTTDANGQIKFNDVPYGTYIFTASKVGYDSLTASTNVSADVPNAQLKIHLNPEPTTGTIFVRVRDKDTDALLDGASVSGGGSTIVADATGRSAFYDLPFGSYTFTASMTGYYSNTGTATISRDKISQSITIYLTAKPTSGKITVTVLDSETNAVITGASVTSASNSGTTDSSGTVTFTAIPLGSHNFTAAKDGYYSNTGTATISESATNSSITIYLDPIPTTGDITVIVRNRDTNAIISGATVTSGLYSGTTNSSGNAVFTDIPFGSYTFTATKFGYFSNTGTASISLSKMTASITIYLTPEPTSGDITVTVRDRDTNAVLSDASVVGGSYSGMTDSSGKIKFTEVDFGSHTFTASKYGYESNTASASISVTSVSASVTVYLTKIKADVGIVAREINGTVYRGSTIMVSADVYGDDLLAFTPDEPLIVKMTATLNGGTVFSTQSESVICPSGENNLVWFEVDMPATGYTSSNVTFEFEVSTPDYVTDTRPSDNKSSKTVSVTTLPDRDAPDADASLDAPSEFSYSVYKNDNARQLTWSVWEWDGGFVKLNYSAKLTVTAKLTPDSTATWSEYNNTERLWYTRSGYGINTEVKVKLSGVPTEMFAGNAKVNAYYPEFNYSTTENRSDMLLMIDEIPSGYGADFTFKPNNDSISRGKMHMTPIWFPDGEYSVRYEIYDVWTPAGMLSADSYAIIGIEGSMYDDYYTQRG